MSPPWIAATAIVEMPNVLCNLKLIPVIPSTNVAKSNVIATMPEYIINLYKILMIAAFNPFLGRFAQDLPYLRGPIQSGIGFLEARFECRHILFIKDAEWYL